MKSLRAVILIVFMMALLVGVLFDATAQSQAYVWKNVEIVGGGYVPGIIYNTRQKDLVYARTDIGGAYRWNTTTSRWVPLTDWVGYDNWSLLGIDSLATDPVDPNRVYLVAGMYTNSWSPINASVLRSSDQGNTWQETLLPFKAGGNMPGRNMGERLAVDPNSNNILYMGTRCGNGLYKSTDYGATWSKVTSFTAVGTYIMDPANDYTKDIIGVVWVTFDPRSSTAGSATKTIYVGVADKGNCVYRSTDAGASWAAVPGQPVGYLPHKGILGSNGLLYVTYSDTCGPYDGSKGDVYKFDTATGVWTIISPIPSTSADDYFGYGGLAVDAQNPNRLVVASLNSWWPDAILFRSVDAGATWIRIWDWASYPSRTLRYTIDSTAAPWLNFGNTAPVDPVPAVKLGWMIGDIDIDPFNSNRMLYGTGATVWATDNLLNWDTGGTIALTVRAQGIEETAVLSLVSPPAGAPLYSGLGDICGFKHDSLSTVPAKFLLQSPLGNATCLDYAELSPNFMARVGSPDTANGGKYTGFSYDNGANWFMGNTDIAGLTGPGMIAAAADASAVVWAPAGAPVSRSTDNGNTWTASTGLAMDARICSDRVNAKKFYAVLAGTFYTSIDGGLVFAAKVMGLSLKAKIRAVPGKEGDIWLAGVADTATGVPGGMWHSTDSGTTFTKISGIDTADTVGFGKAATSQTYPAVYTCAQIGGVRGIFRSDNGGAAWIRINDNQHQWGCTNWDITGDSRTYGRVYIATNGRGIIYGDPSGAAPTTGPTATPTTAPTTSGLKGDVNSDNTITIVDALMLAQYSVGLNPAGFVAARADVNCDGSITIVDALMIAQRYVGLIGSFPC